MRQPAVIVSVTLDPWLCVPAFQQVCLCFQYISPDSILSIAFRHYSIFFLIISSHIVSIFFQFLPDWDFLFPGICYTVNKNVFYHITRSEQMPNFHSARPLILLLLIPVLLFTGCGSSGSDPDEPPVYSPLQVLVPEAPGKKTLGTSPLVLDISDTDQGYLTAVSDSTDQMMNVQLTAEDGVVYSYFISPGESAVIPFSSGSSTYQVSCYQQISDSQYAALYADTLEIKLANEFLPFLYPNQYVNFTPDSEASKLALSMVSEDTSDIDALQTIYNYVVSHVTYDYDLADTVASGYLPNVDETLQTGKGICFDYAALTAAMLRSCDIPCKLQIGYAGDIKHAWINVYIRSRGWVDKAVEFSGDSWSRMDPTFDSNSEDKDTIQEYIGDNNNYTVQFTR